MLWFSLWFLVILKLPALYLAYIIWWAVKDPPDPYADAAGDQGGADDGPGWWPTRHRRRPRPGSSRRRRSSPESLRSSGIPAGSARRRCSSRLSRPPWAAASDASLPAL